MELAVASLLRFVVAEHGADEIETQRIRLQMELMFDDRTGDRGSVLRTQGQRAAAFVHKGVHLLHHDVRGLSCAFLEQLRGFKNRCSDLTVAVQFEQGLGDLFHPLPLAGLTREDVMGALDGS